MRSLDFAAACYGAVSSPVSVVDCRVSGHVTVLEVCDQPDIKLRPSCDGRQRL